jgi:hypothetical protein
MTPHDRAALERYSKGERSLDETCNHIGWTPDEVARGLKETGLPAPSSLAPRLSTLPKPVPGQRAFWKRPYRGSPS